LREANLEHHLEVPGPGAPADANPNSRGKSASAPTSIGGIESKSAAKSGGDAVVPPRFEFGAQEDFQLQQALNQLKGLPVMASSKAVSAQAKPQ
jgi:carboxyl-terminal processing protease